MTLRAALLLLTALWLAGCADPSPVIEAEPVIEAPRADAEDLSRMPAPDCVSPGLEDGDGIGGTGCRVE